MFRFTSFRLMISSIAVAGLLFAAADPVQAARPRASGVGSNLHRSFMIKRAQQQARQGVRVPHHAGIWVGGGFEQYTSPVPTYSVPQHQVPQYRVPNHAYYGQPR